MVAVDHAPDQTRVLQDTPSPCGREKCVRTWLNCTEAQLMHLRSVLARAVIQTHVDDLTSRRAALSRRANLLLQPALEPCPTSPEPSAPDSLVRALQSQFDLSLRRLLESRGP